jgi:hypothetical protein
MTSAGGRQAFGDHGRMHTVADDCCDAAVSIGPRPAPGTTATDAARLRSACVRAVCRVALLVVFSALLVALAGTAQAATGKAHAATGTAHAATGTAHAATGTAHAATGTAQASGSGIVPQRSSGARPQRSRLSRSTLARPSRPVPAARARAAASTLAQGVDPRTAAKVGGDVLDPVLRGRRDRDTATCPQNLPPGAGCSVSADAEQRGDVHADRAGRGGARTPAWRAGEWGRRARAAGSAGSLPALPLVPPRPTGPVFSGTTSTGSGLHVGGLSGPVFLNDHLVPPARRSTRGGPSRTGVVAGIGGPSARPG